MDNLHFSIGDNLGNILLDISQEHLANGEINKVLSTYTQSLEGISEELAVSIMKGEFVIVTADDHETVNVSDKPESIEKAKEDGAFYYDWENIVRKKIEYIREIIKKIAALRKDEVLYDIDLRKLVETVELENGKVVSNDGTINCMARIIGGNQNDYIWRIFGDVVDRVENGMTRELWGKKPATASDNDFLMYNLYYYVENIKNLSEELEKVTPIFDFLEKYNFLKIDDIVPYYVDDFEGAYYWLKEFGENAKYNHPLCDEYIENLKTKVLNSIKNSRFGDEYLENEIIKKNIMHGYDKGWLSPNGDFYGENGYDSELIHITLSGKIRKGPMKNEYFDETAEIYLERHGWLKIDRNKAYSFYAWNDNSESGFYCPTETQIKMLCDYADKFFNGKVLCSSEWNEISTYKLRQMDRIKLHETFYT